MKQTLFSFAAALALCGPARGQAIFDSSLVHEVRIQSLYNGLLDTLTTDYILSFNFFQQQIRDIPYTEYVATVSRKKPLYVSQWNDRLTLYESLYQVYHSSQPFNYGGTEVAPGVDALLEQLIAEVDFDRRKAIAAQAIATIHRVSDRMIPFFINYMCATSSRVQNYSPPLHGVAELRDVWLSA